MREYNFDGLVGLTHNYGGLSAGNVASMSHSGQVANPRAAALEGLRKMRFVRALGVGQAVLPPHPRPSIANLQRLGFRGTDEEVIANAAATNDQLLRLCSSAAAMWTANAATVSPSADTTDGRLHLTPANLHQMFHRAIEADTTTSVLRAIFADERRFAVHEPLPGGGQFADEGAANHTRLFGAGGAAHIFAWGRSTYAPMPTPTRFPARQTRESFEAIARVHLLDPARCVFPRQSASGIDAGAFHTDVLAVGNGSFLMLHELAFADWTSVEPRLRALVGDSLRVELATRDELPIERAVKTYPFNSQVLTLPDGSMTIVAPADAEEDPYASAFLERVVSGDNPVRSVHYLQVRQSMDNGGGPACLRLRVSMTDEEVGAVTARVFLDDELAGLLEAWINRNYRDRLTPSDLADPLLWRECMTALDELTRVLRLGSVYEFQRA